MNVQRLPLLFASVLLAACGNYVVMEGGGPDNLVGNGNGGGGGGGGGASSPAVALTRAQLDVLWDEYWATHDPSGGSSSSGGSADLDPDDLFLRISDLGASCDSPTTELHCGTHFQLSIAIPPALQAVGVYDLDSPELAAYSYMSETGDLHSPPQSADDCSWGGGSLGSGTLEIVAIDANEVQFKINLTGGFWASNPNGTYTALRCPVDQ